ncbi:hypothetical protein B0A48_18755 [Cryoendolithus antarcticus]|uniref:Uncharacterized protein n=1 Tax=Cryoendolithus antarcticus TaxID=1507870 RepID=A0A1V8S7Q9_9PEZI|nr:hypothetical protein B0A48_18755 [Cryoendolithus antarcticus]
MSARWTTIQRQDARDVQLDDLATLDFEGDTLVALPELDEYIHATAYRQHESRHPCFLPSSQIMTCAPDGLPNLPGSNSEDPSYAAVNLMQFEQWVAKRVECWVATYTQADACKQLHELMLRYHALASAYYSGNSEAISVMVLVIFELWVACDKVAVRISPLIGKFDPGIPTAVLQNLLLPYLEQMERLSRVENYLETRRSDSTESTDRMFDTRSGMSYASLYFDKSLPHQQLLSTIEHNANTSREAKREELRDVKANYRLIDTLFNQTDHEYIIKVIDDWCNPPETETVHSRWCPKCDYQAQRESLSIAVHEWPLPCDTFEAKAVVFELRVPLWFGHWRDFRFDLLETVLKGERKQVRANSQYKPSTNDPHLRRYFNISSSQRIGLMSVVKPVSSTHYKSKNITTLTDTQICVRNGLRYQYYDVISDAYMGPITFKDVIPLACTYELPCQALQRFIFRPISAPDGPEPNVVIATQDSCPEDMTLEEYKELATVPLGHHIQWANILLQLAMPGVDFKKPETTLVFLQCIYQAGPPNSSVSRESHDMLLYDENAFSLIRNLTGALQRVKQNWESSQAVRIFTSVAARLLSLSPSADVQKACLTFLKSARDVAMSWILDLREKSYAAVDDCDKTIFTAKSAEVALLCTLTFDVDDHHLADVFAQPNNVSILVQSSIVVQEGEQAHPNHRERHSILLDLRFRRLLYRLYKILAQYPRGLDHAIRQSWSAFEPGCDGWSPDAVDYWMTTETAPVQGASMRVHYNLLSGELLADGLPLNKPPKNYRSHALYGRLFGSSVVEVMPSASPGFQFSTKRAFGGHTVELGMAIPL